MDPHHTARVGLLKRGLLWEIESPFYNCTRVQIFVHFSLIKVNTLLGVVNICGRWSRSNFILSSHLFAWKLIVVGPGSKSVRN